MSRAHVRATARTMREELGLPPTVHLQDRPDTTPRDAHGHFCRAKEPHMMCTGRRYNMTATILRERRPWWKRFAAPSKHPAKS
jgi:hypothetical protein